MEGKDSGDWKLVDAYDVIVHIFHPEKREFYNLEKNVVRRNSKTKGYDMKKNITFIYINF